MGRRPQWRWHKVSTIHWTTENGCEGEIRSHVYRHYPPGDRNFERCIQLAWCADCREYSGQMVHVPARRELPDPLTGLPEWERAELLRSEVRLIEWLDRRR
ncbi:hypothetical protein ACQP2E_17515 [Actinoplanes sp. CA-015351]|uniref:hypothetical protein n=1 Tax=Actinoplanes sp. CA-015351 TaxID=3239897 RepID=UPI003D982CDA